LTLSPSRLHATPTLFPYTTLFRSLSRRLRIIESIRCLPVFREEVVSVSFTLSIMRKKGLNFCFQILHFVLLMILWHVFNNQVSQDRKSTRLNSSHVKISYAVFCLK